MQEYFNATAEGVRARRLKNEVSWICRIFTEAITLSLSLSRLQGDHMTGAGYIMRRAKNTAAERCMSVGFRARTGSQGFGSTGLAGDQEISRSEPSVCVRVYINTRERLYFIHSERINTHTLKRRSGEA